MGAEMMDTSFESEANRQRVTCPFCGSGETEFFSLFGQQLLTVQYYCRTCHTPFEHIKDDDVLSAAEEADRTNSSQTHNQDKLYSRKEER